MILTRGRFGGYLMTWRRSITSHRLPNFLDAVEDDVGDYLFSLFVKRLIKWGIGEEAEGVLLLEVVRRRECFRSKLAVNEKSDPSY